MDVDITMLDDVAREEYLTARCVERLNQKSSRIESLLAEVRGDWAQTIYILLLRYMVGDPNKAAAEHLAHLVPYSIIMRECGTLRGVEALLIGASGLLEELDDDPYHKTLRQEYAHLTAKYSLRAMSHAEWKTERLYPNNQPLMRLVQTAAVLHSGTITIANILGCATPKELSSIFMASVTEHWTHLLGGDTPLAPRLGATRRNILGINFIAPIIYAYGRTIGQRDYLDRSLALLRHLPAEDNRYMRQWVRYGITPKNALESQALLQLSR